MANETIVDDINVIDYIIEQIAICEGFVDNVTLEEFLLDVKSCYAVSMALQIICENANHITDKAKAKTNNIEWKKMSGLRNIISHDYGKIMFEDMYNAVKNDLKKLRVDLIELKELINE